MSEKKKYSELVLEEREKGNVVFLAIDEVMSSPVKEIIKQPVDGLLWDLNRDEATALTFMDREGMVHWVNNFAVALVIRELKAQLSQLEADIKTKDGALNTCAIRLGRVKEENEVLRGKVFDMSKDLLDTDEEAQAVVDALLTEEDRDD